MAVIRNEIRKHKRVAQIDRDILLVEDQRSLAQMAAKMLHDRWGCQVLIATTLEQVRTILAQHTQRFFLAVSDLNLPDAPNGEVIDLLIDAKLPVIAMTGMLDEFMHAQIMNKGVVDYVLKDSVNSYQYIVERVGRLHKNLRTKVLVIDDSESMLSMLTRMLQMQCLQVLTARDGVEATQMLAQHPDIKLLLLDHEMPNMDGMNFLLNVRRTLGKDKLAVIGMSGTDNKRLAAQFLKLGANDFIFIPITYEELVCRITQNMEMQESIEALHYIANHDFLTGLFNRRAFFERGSTLYREMIHAGKPLAAVVMDIDFFKKINDTHGHDGGDAVLKQLAGVLQEYFKEHLIARVGGEEFFLLLKDADKAAALCETFRMLVECTVMKFANAVIPVTISIGVTRQTSGSLDEMLSLADENLYQAKTSGRNRVVLN